MSPDPEKGASAGQVENDRPQSPGDPPIKVTGVDTEHHDEAMKVLGAYTGSLEWTEDEEKAVRRRLDWRLMPALCITFGLQHYDKSMLSQAVRRISSLKSLFSSR